MRLGAGKHFGCKLPVGAPEGPEGEQDFALGVQPRMGGGPGVAAGKLIAVPDGTGAAFGGLKKGAIGDGLQGADAVAIELLVAQGFVIAGAIANAQPAIACELRELLKAGRVLDIGDKEMRAHEADARNGAQPLDFGELPSGLDQQPTALGLTVQCLVQQFIEDQGLRTQRVVGQLF